MPFFKCFMPLFNLKDKHSRWKTLNVDVTLLTRTLLNTAGVL